jgi:hypothetical protein
MTGVVCLPPRCLPGEMLQEVDRQAAVASMATAYAVLAAAAVFGLSAATGIALHMMALRAPLAVFMPSVICLSGQNRLSFEPGEMMGR